MSESPSGERQAAALELLASYVLEEVRRLESNDGVERDEHDDDDEPDIRLICCDVDGTLLTPEHTVTQRTIDTILKVMSIDDDLTFCTCQPRPLRCLQRARTGWRGASPVTLGRLP